MISLGERDWGYGKAGLPNLGRDPDWATTAAITPIAPVSDEMREIEIVRGVAWQVKHLGAYLVRRLARRFHFEALNYQNLLEAVSVSGVMTTTYTIGEIK